MSVAELSDLMTNAVPMTPGLMELREDADAPRWAAVFEDGTVVVAEWIPARGVLALSADLGFPPEEHISTVQETLLVYNSLRHRTAGASMALAEPAGELVHLCDLDRRDITPAKLATSLSDFAKQSSAWRKVVADGARIDAALAEAASRALDAVRR